MRYKVTYTNQPHEELGLIRSRHESTGVAVVNVSADSESDALAKTHQCVDRRHMRYYSIEAL